MPRHLLSGVRVLELADGMYGPYCGKLLADLGADVIKVESPAGDSLRQRGPFPGGTPDPEKSGFFLYVNAGKRGIVLDLEVADDRGVLLDLVASVDIVVEAVGHADRDRLGIGFDALAARNPSLVVVSLTPFGTWGPNAAWSGNDLIAAHSSGFAFGFPSHQVDTPDLPPLNPPGHSVEIMAAEMAAGAALHGLLAVQQDGRAVHIDLSVQEALAAENHHRFNVADRNPTRDRIFSTAPQGGAIGILPCTDGWVVISPRERDQWARWLEAMGNPEWGTDPRYSDRVGRERHWVELHPLLSAFTETRSKAEVFALAREYRVACLPLGTGPDLLDSPQLEARGFLQKIDDPDLAQVRMPGVPYKVSGVDQPVPRRAPRLGEHQQEVLAELESRESSCDVEPSVPVVQASARVVASETGANGAGTPSTNGAHHQEGEGQSAVQPLRGLRVVDFSWVVGGPICTKYLAALGADVIKIESKSRPDLSHRNQTWEDMNPGKRSLTLNMKHDEGREIARRLIAASDVVVENFSYGVMERFGLGYEDLRALNPRIIMASLSSAGRTGPEREVRAYGTLIQCFTGWAGLSRYPHLPPRTPGGVWTDPLAALLLADVVLAAIWRQRRTGEGCAIDLSMVEATITSIPEPILAWTMNGEDVPPRANRDPLYGPQGCYRSDGDDAWVALTVRSDAEWATLCRVLGRDDLAADPTLATVEGRRQQHDRLDAEIAAWTSQRSAGAAAAELQAAGIAASPSMNPIDALTDPHLTARGLFGPIPKLDGGTRLAPRVPWLINGVRPDQLGRPPDVGQHNEPILREVLGFPEHDVERLIAEQAVY